MRAPLAGTRSGFDSWDATMTPMIDVVFNLLIFFVWTCSFQVAERLLPSGLLPPPGGSQSTAVDVEMVDFDLVVVSLHWQQEMPQWLVNGKVQTSREQLRGTLTAIATIKSDIPVVIEPDRMVPLHAVIDVYDIGRRAGFTKIQFATEQYDN